MCIICLSIRIDFIINLHRTENKMLKLIFRAKHIAQFNILERMPNGLNRNFVTKTPDDESDVVHLEDPGYITIPEYPVRPNEPLEQRRQRLLYQSRKRGMLENDLLLSTFAAKYLKTMTSDQLEMYDTLINKPSNDWDIYNWALGSKPTPINYENEIMDMFRRHVKNDLKEKRLRMPDL